jgi:hypothetical protein
VATHRHPSQPKYSASRAVLCIATAVAIGAFALVTEPSSPSSTTRTLATTPVYLPADNSGIIRVALILGVVLLILVQLWLLGRRPPGERVLLPVQRSDRRKRSGSSSVNPNSSTRNW